MHALFCGAGPTVGKKALYHLLESTSIMMDGWRGRIGACRLRISVAAGSAAMHSGLSPAALLAGQADTVPPVGGAEQHWAPCLQLDGCTRSETGAREWLAN